MKKFSALLLTAAVFCGCSDSKSSVSGTDDITDTTAENVTGTQAAADTQPADEEERFFILNGVEMEIPSDLGFSPADDDIFTGDTDRDGCDDVYFRYKGRDEEGRLYIYDKSGKTIKLSETKTQFSHDRKLLNTYSEPPYLFVFRDDRTDIYSVAGNCFIIYCGRTEEYTDNGDSIVDTYYYNSLSGLESLICRTVNGEEVIVDSGQLEIVPGKGKINVTSKSTGETVQVLEDITFADDTVILYKDYDFDGHVDILAKPKYVHGSMGGRFFRFDPEAKRFVPWDKLNELGEKADIDTGDGRLVVSSYTMYKDIKTEYEWQDDDLHEVSYTEIYGTSSLDVRITDYFSPGTDGERVLVRRQYTNTENGAKFRSIDYPVYFRTDGGNVSVMRNEEIIQTIGGCRLNELADEYNSLDAPDKVRRSPLDLLYSADYDFDGDDDLFIADEYDSREGFRGRYFRFDGENFTEWDELNAVGTLLYTGYNGEKRLYKYSYRAPFESFCYEWQYSGIVCTERTLNESDGEGGHNVYTYKKGADGSEVLTGRVHHTRELTTEYYEYTEDGSEVLVKTEGA